MSYSFLVKFGARSIISPELLASLYVSALVILYSILSLSSGAFNSTCRKWDDMTSAPPVYMKRLHSFSPQEEFPTLLHGTTPSVVSHRRKS